MNDEALFASPVPKKDTHYDETKQILRGCFFDIPRPRQKKILLPKRYLRFCCNTLEFSSKCHENVRKSLYYGIVKQFDSLSVSHKLFHMLSEQIDWTSLFFMFLSSFSVKLGKNMKNRLRHGGTFL